LIPPEDKQKCVQGLEIILKGGNHKCDSAVFKIYLNDVLLLRDKDNAPYASLNNYAKFNGEKVHGISFDESSELQKYDNALNGYQDTKGDPGGNRENRFIITDDIAKQALLSNPNELIISLMCWNPLDYFEDGTGAVFGDEPGLWGFDCHEGVGTITLKSTNGKTANYPSISTPGRRNIPEGVIGLDPCTLKQIHGSAYFNSQRISANRKRTQAQKDYDLSLSRLESQLQLDRITRREFDQKYLELGNPP